MNARQKAKTDMYNTVELVCSENDAVLGEVVAFQNSFNNFRSLLAQVFETEQIRLTPITGITADKSADRANLCKSASVMAGSIAAYASITKNETLKSEVAYSYSRLLQMREDQFLAVCQNLHALATQNRAALEDYGITSAKLASLQAAIEAFRTAMPKPRAAKGQKTTLTANIDEILTKIDDILLNQLDLLIGNFDETQPNFAARYREARKIKDPATTATQLKGKVTNQSDGTIIKDATVTIVEPGMSKQTNSRGEYSFKPVSFGEFTVRATAAGFQDFEIAAVRVKLGEVNRLNIQLFA